MEKETGGSVHSHTPDGVHAMADRTCQAQTPKPTPVQSKA